MGECDAWRDYPGKLRLEPRVQKPVADKMFPDSQLINTAVGMPFLFRPLLHAQNYLWCRSNATMTMSIFGLFSLPVPCEFQSSASLFQSQVSGVTNVIGTVADYPIALIALELILGGVPKAIAGAVGMLAGHTWWVEWQSTGTYRWNP